MSAESLSQPPWPTPQTLCRRCGAERNADLEPEHSRVDFAGGHHELCLACWHLWIDSAAFRSAAASPCPDRNALGWWVEEARP